MKGWKLQVHKCWVINNQKTKKKIFWGKLTCENLPEHDEIGEEGIHRGEKVGGIFGCIITSTALADLGSLVIYQVWESSGIQEKKVHENPQKGPQLKGVYSVEGGLSHKQNRIRTISRERRRGRRIDRRKKFDKRVACQNPCPLTKLLALGAKEAFRRREGRIATEAGEIPTSITLESCLFLY